MDYEDAEAAGSGRQDTDGNPTLAQWARAEALKAIMSNPKGQPLSLSVVADHVNALAELIVTGSLPEPPRGTTY